MIRYRAFTRSTSAIIVALVAGLGCGTDDAVAPPSPQASVDTAGQVSTSAADDDLRAPLQGCVSKISAAGLLCTRCAGDAPGAPAECLAAECTVDRTCLKCTDPKGRVVRDCTIDYGTFNTGSLGGSSNNEFNFASCTFQWGIPRVSGTTCQYPGADTCDVTEDGDTHCLECNYPDGSANSLCRDTSEPLIDPLIDRPDDLPGPNSCVNDLSADGKVECTTCVFDDLSATRSCHYPGLVACDLFNQEDQAAGCLGRCTFKDGHQERICDSPRGPHPVPLPAP